MQALFSRATGLIFSLTFIAAINSSAAHAQYKVTNLVSSQKGKAAHQDSALINAWGITNDPGGAFWISDAGSGETTLYNASGVSQGNPISIPSASGSAVGSPTGVVYNRSSGFVIDDWTSEFIYATLDGTISGWSQFVPNTAIIGLDNSHSGASYTGLAISAANDTLYAADTANNEIDMINSSFQVVKTFTDSTIPAGFVVSGIQDINGKLYVAYVASSGGAGGYIDIFSEAGTFQKRFAHGAPLNQPWGFALAPKNFGALSSALLIANNTNSGTIVAYNVKTGKYIGTLKSNGKAVKINQLWGIRFGDGHASTGAKNALFFTAGPNNNLAGLFGVITAE